METKTRRKTLAGVHTHTHTYILLTKIREEVCLLFKLISSCEPSRKEVQC